MVDQTGDIVADLRRFTAAASYDRMDTVHQSISTPWPPP